MLKSVAREPGEKSPQGTPTRRRVFRLVLWYVVVGSLWLLVSDGIVGHFVRDQARAEVLHVVGDCLYVVVSAIMLTWLLERWFGEIRRTAHLLEENEARLRIISDGLPDCIVYQYTRDADGKPRFTYASAGVERVFGLKPAEVLHDGSRIFALFDPAQLPPYAAAKTESARQMTDFDMELRVQRAGGQVRLIHARSRPRLNEQGRVVWDGFATDITERRRIESDQMVAATRYRSLFDNMPNGLAHCRIIVEDGKAVDFLYLDVNPAFRKLTGLTNVVGRLASEVFPGIRSADPALIAAYGRVALTGVPEQFETHVETLKNWFAISVYRPAPEHFVAVFDVITERKQAEEALSESEEKFRQLAENIDDVFWISSPDLNVLHYVSPAYEKVWGHPIPSLYANPLQWVQAIAPRHRDAVLAVFVRLRDDATVANVEYEITRPDGTIRWIHDRGFQIRDAAGQVIRIGGIASDVTERRRAGEALRLSEMKFARAFANNPAAIALTRLDDGTIFEVNDTWVALHGFGRAQIIGQSARALWPIPESAAQFVRELHEKGTFRGLQEFRKKSGELFVAEISAQVLTIEGEQLILSTLLDVTARQQAEAALLRSQTDLAAAQKLASLGNWRFDIATNTVEWSDELYHIFDIEKTASDGSYEAFLDRVLPEDRPRVRETNAKAKADGESFQVEYRIQTRAGQLRTIQEAGHVLKDAAGAVVGLFGVAQDITERKQAEMAQRRSEQNYREIFNATNEAILIHDAVTGDVLDVNAAASRMHGYGSKDDFLADKFGRMMDPNSPYNWDVARRRIRLAIEEGPQVFEWLHHRKNGEAFWVEVSLRSTQIGGAGRVLAVVRDITERKQAEMALRQSEEQFRAMFETSSVGMGQSDTRTGRFMRVNRKMCEITGYSEAELLQLKVPDITHPGDRERDWELYQRVVQDVAPNYHIEKRYVRKDGKLAWVNVNMNVLRDAAGQPVRAMATIEDITERRKSEEERLRLSTALEQTSESIVITDLAGMILYVNPAFERITGYSRREAIGQNPRLLKSGRHDAAFYKQLWATLSRGEVWHGHFVNRRKDGTYFEENATISPVRDASGKIVNYMAIKLDVSREMDLENQFRQAQKLEAIGQLAGGVAHDFNNILTSIMMQIALGSMGDDLSADTKESFEQIRRDADRAASLTRQLLLFSRRQVMQSQDLDLNQVVTNLAKMLQRIIGEDVRLQLNLHPSPLLAHADAGMLDQVAMNLSVNARDAMPQGGQLVIATSEKIVDEELARHQPDAAPGRYVCLSVTDTGCGIAPEVLPRIFEPFFTTKETGKGTGLGLATVFGIVKQHRGWITVASQPGQGTTFKVFLPAIAAAAALAAVEVRSQPRGGTETILLAEDESMVRRSIGSILTRNGYQVLEAANGEGALRLWANHRARVALLLTDLVMPGGVTGQQLARRLQADNPSLKVLYTSGYSAEIAGRELRLQNGENFIQKPLNPGELLETVRACLDRATT